jgi:hypothetical protein
MLKWVLRILYIMILSMATMYVFGSSNYERLTQYYDKYMKDYLNESGVYLQGINTIMNLDYHKEIMDPKTYTSSDGKKELTLNFYAIGATQGGVFSDGLLIFLNNIRIENEDGLIEFPVIKIEVLLSEKSYDTPDGKSDIATVEYNPNKDFPYSYVPAVVLLKADKYLLIKGDDTTPDSFATIVAIFISYGIQDKDGKVNYEQTLLFSGSNTILEDPAFIKTDDFVIDETLYSLSDLFEGNRPTADEIEQFGLITTRGDLTEFNGLIWKNMIIFTLVATALTYVLFFHKIFWEKIRERKQANQPVVTRPKQDAIFIDVEEKKQDGK